jgi:dTDP-4-dehydrorhamnose reductase
LNILVTGQSGQLGSELGQVLNSLGKVILADRRSMNLEDPAGMRDFITSHRPNVIVNAAAYTAVDKAESEPELAHRINCIGPKILAEEADKLGALLVHYSSDYVFDGKKSGSYVESDLPAPLNVYGKTKLAGEDAIRASGCRHLIFRTSWVYGVRGGNFLLTMLRLLEERPLLRVVDDQIGAPTSTATIAKITCDVLRQGAQKQGTFHLTTSGHTSWHGFARLIAAEWGQDPERIQPIPSTEYPTAATRPANSTLDCSRLRLAYACSPPSWDEEAKRILKSMKMGTPK